MGEFEICICNAVFQESKDVPYLSKKEKKAEGADIEVYSIEHFLINTDSSKTGGATGLAPM